MISNRWIAVAAALATMTATADAFAQRGALRGKLVDEEGRPLAGVVCNIELQGGGGRASKMTTKENGEFVKGGLQSGDYVVTCEMDGYRPLPLAAPITAFEQIDLGENVMYRLAAGELSEKDHARVTELLEKFNVSSKSDDHQATLASLLELEKMMPESAEILFNIGSTYENLNDPDKALEYYKKATALKPDLYDAWLAIGDIYGKRKSWADAASAMKKAIALKADPVHTLNYAIYAQNSGDVEGAEGGYQKTLELDPKSAMAHYQLGLIAVSKEQNEAAIAHFEKFLELAPNDPQAEAAKGVIEALKQKTSGE
ncbi:MAG: tetratricopeptide repeat protein [Vicinamibacteria bacterium]